jgi:hypothetical protein
VHLGRFWPAQPGLGCQLLSETVEPPPHGAGWRRRPKSWRADGAGGGETSLGGGRRGEEPDLGVGVGKKLIGAAVNGGGIRPEGNGGEASCLVAFGAFGWVGEHHDGQAKLVVESAGQSRGRRCRATVGRLRRRKESGGAMARVAPGLLAVDDGSKTGHNARRRSRRRRDDSGGWTRWHAQPSSGSRNTASGSSKATIEASNGKRAR